MTVRRMLVVAVLMIVRAASAADGEQQPCSSNAECEVTSFCIYGVCQDQAACEPPCGNPLMCVNGGCEAPPEGCCPSGLR